MKTWLCAAVIGLALYFLVPYEVIQKGAVIFALIAYGWPVKSTTRPLVRVVLLAWLCGVVVSL